MNETTSTPPTEEFDPHRLRTITDMQRSDDDRILGGVCAGAAKYLNIDPVIVRVIIAVLTVVGLAGVIIYAAAWLLLPAESADKSVAARWFNLDKNEEQVRVAGLVGAAVLAALAVFGNDGYAWWGLGWVLVPVAALYWLFVVRPRRKSNEDTAALPMAATTAPDSDGDQTLVAQTGTPKPPKQRKSPALFILTISVAAIAVALTRIYADLNGGAPWTTYVAIALGIIGLGLLVGTFFGNAGWLIPIGVLLAAMLAVGSLVPNGKIAEEGPAPLTAAEVDADYEYGLGYLRLDLTDISDPDNLLGRTVDLTLGVGQTQVIVPRDLNVSVTADLNAGEVEVFGRVVHGTDNALEYPATAGQPALNLNINQQVGNIEVIRK